MKRFCAMFLIICFVIGCASFGFAESTENNTTNVDTTFDFSEDCEDIFDALDIKHLSQTESAVGLRLKYGIDDLAPYWAKYDDKPRHRMVMPKGQGDHM